MRHPVSLIVTLTKQNAAHDVLPQLLDWFRDLDRRGLRYINLHLLEVDNPGVREQLALSVEENVNALMSCYELQKSTRLKFEPLTDMEQMLRGELVDVSCTWNGCDPYTTAAVQGIDGQGNKGNCGRTSKDGPLWEKATTPGYERYLALAYAPQEIGGCKDCSFFALCKGHCPGEGENNDWRGKTEHCAVLMRVFESLEKTIDAPITQTPLIKQIEERQIALWSRGQNATLKQLIQAIRMGERIDANMQHNHPHGDAPHGDSPHGDSHGDHTDTGARR
jgi:uncharacterized protein